MPQNQHDFDQLYSTFHPKIRRYLARKVGETEAEDLLQAVFLRVSQALPQFRGKSSVKTWIYRIAANVVTDKMRSVSSRETCHDAADGATNDGAVLFDEADSGVDQNLIRTEMNECIRGIVNRLPEQSLAVIKLSEYEGMKNSEIAEALGTSVANVKIRLHRARVRLKKDLAAQCRLYRDERNELVCDPKNCL